MIAVRKKGVKNDKFISLSHTARINATIGKVAKQTNSKGILISLNLSDLCSSNLKYLFFPSLYKILNGTGARQNMYKQT